MAAHSGGRGGDMLTRTTLTVGAELPTAAAPLIAALKRVPGVLLAEWLPAQARAVVAHDAAVPLAALIAAARGIGVQARVLTEKPAAAAATMVPASAPGLRARSLLTVAAVLLVAVALMETMFPRLASNHLVLPLLLTGVWAFFLTDAFLRRVRR
jgi:hypothetical protein